MQDTDIATVREIEDFYRLSNPSIYNNGTEKDPSIQLRQDLRGALNNNKNIASLYKNGTLISINQQIDSLEIDPDLKNGIVSLRKYDPLNYVHSLNVSLIAFAISRNLKQFGEDNLKNVFMGALLHDAGMMPYKGLVYQEQLNDKDRIVLQEHPLRGAYILRHYISPASNEIIFNMVKSHHRMLDGTGYGFNPLTQNGGFTQEERVISLADRYEALTTPRHYRGDETFTPAEAQGILEMEAQKGKVDKKCLEVLCSLPLMH